jgi:SnoaL-like domain
MTLKLPAPIAGYFDAERSRDAASMSLRFAANAVVKDDGEVHVGREAIQTWMSEAWNKYNATTEPTAVAQQGASTVVTCRVAGDFRGSPVDLRYDFVLADDLIAQLEVTL